jgi:hypothetical protein
VKPVRWLRLLLLTCEIVYTLAVVLCLAFAAKVFQLGHLTPLQAWCVAAAVALVAFLVEQALKRWSK